MRSTHKTGVHIAVGGFRTLVLERFWFPQQITESRPLYHLGHHKGVYQSEKLHSRTVAPQTTLARICREAGAVVRTNVMLRDMNFTVSAHEERNAEILASGFFSFFFTC